MTADEYDAAVTDGWNRAADEAHDVVLRVLDEYDAERLLAVLPGRREPLLSVRGAEVAA